MLKTTVLNVGYEMLLRGSKQVHANREKYNCNVPMLILFDPTSACNMHCEGCWSGTYGHKDNLTYEEMDRIMTQGEELGVHLYLLTGGEPLVRKKDIIRLADAHPYSEIGIFTNSTLIDETSAKRSSGSEISHSSCPSRALRRRTTPAAATATIRLSSAPWTC